MAAELIYPSSGVASVLFRSCAKWVPLLASLAAPGLFSQGAGATTYLITPDGTGAFATIQEALDVAVDGDSVLLGDGVFELDAPLEGRGPAIVLRSLTGDPRRCSLVSLHYGPTIHLYRGETNDMIVEGVTLSGAENREGYGGAMLCYGASPTIRDCVLEGNRAIAGAGICCWQSTATIEDCLFEDNIAGMDYYPGWGGGILVTYGAVRILSCTFISNGAGGTGGGIDTHDGNTTIIDCRILGSTFEGVYCIGGAVEVRNCVITGNSSSGVWCHEGTGMIVGSTIAGNRGDGEGGGIRVSGGAAVSVEKSIVWGNCARGEFDNVYVDGVSQTEFACCIVDSSGVGGEGSITGLSDEAFADPEFCAPAPCGGAPTDQGDYSIALGSPCAPELSPCGELVGALSPSCAPPLAQPMTWGAIKAMFGR